MLKLNAFHKMKVHLISRASVRKGTISYLGILGVVEAMHHRCQCISGGAAVSVGKGILIFGLN